MATKVIAIQEAKDLTKLPLEELIESLMTYEINLVKKQQEGEDKKKKIIALKATTKEEEKEVEKEKQSEEDEDLALIARKFNKFMRGERFKGRRFTSRRDLAKNESSSHGDTEKWEEKRDLVCFKCKKLGHMKYDCPLYKSEAKRRKKKAMMATWSESEESFEEENGKEVANMYFMVIDELDEVNFNLSDEDIHDVFEELYKDFEKLSLENIYLKKKIQQLEKEFGEVKENFSNVEISKTHLEKENEILRKKNEWLTSSISIFSYGQKYFKMILASQKCVFDKQWLGFKSSKNQKYLKNYFVKESTNASSSITCNFC